MRLLTLALLYAAMAAGQTPTIQSRTALFKKMPGLFPLYLDERAGKLYLEIGQWDQEFLYQDSLPAGVGSNDIGLDRGVPRWRLPPRRRR